MSTSNDATTFPNNEKGNDSGMDITSVFMDNDIRFPKDLTTYPTRICNRNPRIMAEPPGFIGAIKTEEDIFKESQERVVQHFNDLLSSQTETFEDSINKIDEMSQENINRIDKLEKSLSKLRKLITKRRRKIDRATKMEEANEKRHF